MVCEKALNSAKSTRRKQYDFVKIKQDELAHYVDDGWEMSKEYKNPKFVGVSREKSVQEQFENKIWLLFASMGFSIMNSDREFFVAYDFRDDSLVHQVDVLAVDDETIIMVECYAADEMTDRSFAPEIKDFSEKISGLRKEILKRYPNRKSKFIWATHNYIIQKKDLIAMEKAGITYFNDSTVEYYTDLSKHLGSCSRYQLLGSLFANQEIKNMDNRIPAIQGKMGGYTYYSFSIEPEKLLKVGYVLHRNEANQNMMPTYQRIIKKARLTSVRNFINEEPVGYKIYEMEHPDVLLWAVWALQQYAKETSREQCRQKYGELLKDIMEFIRQRKHENLFLHDNGLLFANGTDKAITWMNSTVNGHPVIPRTGYIVEFNALWYNALRFIADLVREGGDVYLADELDAQAEVTGKSFVEVFRNEYGYLLDYVDGNMMDWSVRPNMIFTVAFDYSPLDRAQKKQVLDIVTKELLTPKGIRSLSPKSGGYNPNYVGPQIQRDYAYHQGTAWPWLMGFYLEAYLRIYKMSGLSFVERQLISYDDEMTSHCVGSIPELFDGNPPFKGRGAVSFAMNVAEILRVLKLLSKYY